MSRRYDVPSLRSWCIVAIAVFGLVASSACSSDETRSGRNLPDDSPDRDSGTPADTVSPDTEPAPSDDAGMADVAEQRDGGQPDGSADGSSGSSLPPVQTQQLCASGGVAQSSEYTLIQCTAPVDLSGETMEGSGYQLQPGAFRVISE